MAQCEDKVGIRWGRIGYVRKVVFGFMLCNSPKEIVGPQVYGLHFRSYWRVWAS